MCSIIPVRFEGLLAPLLAMLGTEEVNVISTSKGREEGGIKKGSTTYLLTVAQKI